MMMIRTTSTLNSFNLLFLAVLLLNYYSYFQIHNVNTIPQQQAGYFVTAALSPTTTTNNNNNGWYHYNNGKKLFEEQKYDDAAMELWKAILFHGSTINSDVETYDVTIVFQQFMQCYIIQNKMVDGLAFVASESYRRGQNDMGYNYLQQALEIDPTNAFALAVQEEFNVASKIHHDDNNNKKKKINSYTDDNDNNDDDYDADQQQSKQQQQQNFGKSNDDLVGKTPEQLYEIASRHFTQKEYEDCADIFEISCQKSNKKLGPSCANAVYCRNLIVDWGYNGTQFINDMQRVVEIMTNEVRFNRYVPVSTTTTTTTTTSNTASGTDDTNKQFAWQRSTSVHPHMMLGYPIDPMLKRYSAESASYLDEKVARASLVTTTTSGTITSEAQLPPLPDDMPFDIELMRRKFQNEFQQYNNYNNNTTTTTQPKLRIGFVGSGFNSKAVLFLSHDMFRFFDPNKYEIHIFSFGPPDHPLFIKHGMRGVDWRERVKSNVHYFHDCNRDGPLQLNDHIKAARYINNYNIHILIEWDGFARQGERAQGLFALRPSPIQILHQEYLGTSGALYVDYLFSDIITTPVSSLQLYTEKIIWLPNHFFSKGHAYQNEVMVPTVKYKPAQNPYQFGTGTPQENRCLAAAAAATNYTQLRQKVSFVYCNFNKLLKANPDTVRSWITILRSVPDSLLCLVENPKSAIQYLRRFIYEATMTLNDGDELNSRIHFLPWERNPFDHQARNQDMCNVMLDSHPYNGHTVAQDALYGGVPIVTRSDSLDMSSRVSTSANIVLGLDELNAYNGRSQYESIAISLGNNRTRYNAIRKHLIMTCNQRNPMHPYWDVARYVKNFENGLDIVWKRFLDGLQPDHIRVEESSLAAKGTYDDEIIAHPTIGNKNKSSQTVDTVEDRISVK